MDSTISLPDSDHPQEYCGVIGVYAPVDLPYMSEPLSDYRAE